MPDHSSDGERQCRRGVELDAAMAGAGPRAPTAVQMPPVQHTTAQATAAGHEDEVLASTRLSLELGKVGIQSSSCSSSSSAGHPAQQALQVAAAAPPGHGPRPRHMLTEAEEEAKRLRRVLANRESARQTILRRQAIRDELARKVADLSSRNENMKKEKAMVMQEYLSLKETNEQLKEQVAKTAKKASAPATVAMDTSPPALQAEAMPSTATTPHTPPPAQPSFLYTEAPPTVPVPYVWGSWPPGYEHGNPRAGPAAAPLCLPPCAWYYPVVADPRGSPTSYPQPFQDQPRVARGTAEEDTDDDPCSLTLAIDVDKKGTSNTQGGSGVVGLQGSISDREKATEARKRRKELTKLKQMHAGGRPGG